MASICRLGDSSTGHGGFPPTALIQTPVSKTFFEGSLAGVVGAMYAPHVRGRVIHAGGLRMITQGSPKTFVEGSPIARQGDSIVCGDTVGPGATKSSA
jgi:uncharacterized Zn-binding protein involved in type VI secretion